MIFNKILKIMFGREEKPEKKLTVEDFDEHPLNPKKKAKKNGKKTKPSKSRG